MKQKHIDAIKAKLTYLGCHLGSDGKCYYICGNSWPGDYGRMLGYDAYAFREDAHGELQRGSHLRFMISEIALSSDRVSHLIGEKATYARRASVAHLAAMLYRGELDTENTMELRSTDDEAAFEIPPVTDPIVGQQRLRDDIIRRLAYLHHDGQAVVSYSTLLDGLCADIEWVQRALRILDKRGLIKGIADGNLVLTDEGHVEAEKTVMESPATVVRAIAVGPAIAKLDCFLSYASEDRATVREIVKALIDRDLQVWWDRGQITLGDRLSKKIDEGLSNARYGLVIVSESFMAKRWPDAELRALANRSINSGQKVVLPVLLGVTHDRFASAYPLLADIVTTQFSGDYISLVDEVVRAVE